MPAIEVYQLQCGRCAEPVEIPAAAVDLAGGATRCPSCSAELLVEWRPRFVVTLSPAATL